MMISSKKLNSDNYEQDGQVVVNTALMNIDVNSTRSYLSSQDRAPLAHTLTDAQWEAIVNIFNSSNKKSSKENLSSKWILDTGASRHMTGSKEFLCKTYKISFSSVKLPNGTYTIAPCEGTAVFGDNMRLYRVLYVPDLHCNLISLACLIKDLKCIVTLTDKLCVIQDRTTRTMIGVGEERDGVYIFHSGAQIMANRVTTGEDYNLWHMRLGHPSNKIVSLLPGMNKVDCQKFLNEPCDTCFKAKQTRVIFPISENKAVDIFSLVHCDVWVFFESKFPYGVESLDDNNEGFHNDLDTRLEISSGQLELLVSDSTANPGVVQGVSGGAPAARMQGLSGSDNTGLVAGVQDMSSGVSRCRGPVVVEDSDRISIGIQNVTGVPNSTGVKRGDSQMVSKSQNVTSDFFENSETFVSSGVGVQNVGTTNISENSKIYVPFVSSGKVGKGDISKCGPLIQVSEHSNSSGVIVQTVSGRDSPDNTRLPGSISSEGLSTLLPATESHIPISDISDATVRRSARSRISNTRLKDYVCSIVEVIDPSSSTPHSSTSSGTPYPITNYISCANFSANHIHFLAAITTLKEPTSYAEVVRIPFWRVAMSKEISALDKNGTLSVTDLPPGKKAIGCKWV
ncbi:uncharacterized protein LOC113311978 [Papaver somniferum]|uniref:uncharacterized protein LOC113311978 n=1 Tax=Papaver somniferum TaxID=3469 RepID=UPI000E700345|nr:uncharacterized protein LOC113311978 [Papaver somniferum]